MKRLAIDIETRPNLAHVWGLWDQNVGLKQLLEPVDMICWAAKWFGEPQVSFRSIHSGSRKQMVKAAWRLLDEADVVVHYNGRSFDVPHLNREFLAQGLKPPAPYRQIDLLHTVRRQFRFPSNKLAYVSEALGLGGKVEHEGHELWVKCLAGDKAAWGRMERYNVQDVLLLERLYDRLLPWIKGHPSFGALLSEDVCPSCGSSDLQRRGVARTKVSTFQRFQCRACGSWSRATKRVGKTGIVEVAA